MVGALVGLMAVMIFLNIVLRILGIQTIEWVNEMAEYALYVSAFFAAPWVLRLGLHVRIDILANTLPKKIAYWLERIVDVVGIIICATVAYYSALASYAAYESGSAIYKNLIIPEWPVLAVIPISFVMLTIEFMLRLGTDPDVVIEHDPKAGGF